MFILSFPISQINVPCDKDSMNIIGLSELMIINTSIFC